MSWNFGQDCRVLRHAEFARACLDRTLQEATPTVMYYGMLRHEQDDVRKYVGSMLYDHWDKSQAAPAKQRPRDPIQPPQLSALSFANGTVGFPDALLTKFAKATPEHKMMQNLKTEVADMFASSLPIAVGGGASPATPAVSVGSGVGNPSPAPGKTVAVTPRAVGRPDWSIEGGKKPPSLEKLIHLEHVPAASFGVTRPVNAFLMVKCRGVVL